MVGEFICTISLTESLGSISNNLNTKLDKSKINFNECQQVIFSTYSHSTNDYDIDFRLSDRVIMKFRFHVLSSNIEVFESTDNGITWNARRNGDTVMG